MTMITDFSLPSDPSKIVRLREATVADAMDFSDVDEAHEEALTTLFLEKMQDKATYSDPRLWTGDDRRLALYWYFLHTAKETDVPLTYRCPHCQETHTVLYETKQIADTYKPIQGRPERDIEHEGRKYTVRPLNGAALELLENMQIELEVLRNALGDTSGKVRRQNAQIKFKRFCLCVEDVDAEGKTPEARAKATEQRFLAMNEHNFKALAEKADAALVEMEHGLPSVYENGRMYLFTTPVQCPKKQGEPDATIRLRLPFWAFDYVPTL